MDDIEIHSIRRQVKVTINFTHKSGRSEAFVCFAEGDDDAVNQLKAYLRGLDYVKEG